MKYIELQRQEDVELTQSVPSVSIDMTLLFAVRHLLNPTNMDKAPVRALLDVQSAVDEIISGAREEADRAKPPKSN